MSYIVECDYSLFYTVQSILTLYNVCKKGRRISHLTTTLIYIYEKRNLYKVHLCFWWRRGRSYLPLKQYLSGLVGS